jgi:hypothetical protein
MKYSDVENRSQPIFAVYIDVVSEHYCTYKSDIVDLASSIIKKKIEPNWYRHGIYLAVSQSHVHFLPLTKDWRSCNDRNVDVHPVSPAPRAVNPKVTGTLHCELPHTQRMRVVMGSVACCRISMSHVAFVEFGLQLASIQSSRGTDQKTIAECVIINPLHCQVRGGKTCHLYASRLFSSRTNFLLEHANILSHMTDLNFREYT